MKHTPTSKRKAPVKWAMIGLTAAALSSLPALKAQSNVDGAIVGKVSGAGTVVAESAENGTRRSVTIGKDGSYRISSLPPGRYTVTVTSASGAPESKEVLVSVGTTSTVVFGTETDKVVLDAYNVSEAPISPIDFGKTTSSLVLSKDTIDTIPLPRTRTSVALLTPGTIEGDNQFNLIGVGRVASFGGASVAENAYYVNGFNLTNFRNGLGGSNVPFDFYEQFEVINGAYSAQYGRSTGGVINGTTKRGSNTYKADAFFSFRENAWRDPSVYFVDKDTGATEVAIFNEEDYSNTKEYYIQASGALWKDKLFFSLHGQRTETSTRAATGSGTTLTKDSIANPFYAAKLDFTPFEGQRLEYTFFSDLEITNRSNYRYSYLTQKVTNPTAYSTPSFRRGGKNHIFGYSGVFFEDLTVSATYGEGRFSRSNISPQDSLPYVRDARGPLASSPRVLQGVSSVITAEDYRKAKRADVEYAFDFLGKHRLRVGYDSESNFSLDQTQYGGGERYQYVSTAAGRKVLGVTVPTGVTELIYRRIYKTGGTFQVKSDAYYVEDNWGLLNDRLLFRLGYRDETFENLNAQGKAFIKVENQRSPRIGVSYDLFGNQKTKLLANYGRYFLPVATNTNIRLAGGEYDRQTYYLPGGGSPSANGIPSLGAQFADSLVSDGSVPDTTSVVDKNLKPMYQDEWVVGVQHQLTKNWNVQVRGIYRNLGSSFDDLITDQALNAYAAANGLPDQTESYHYVLANPGAPATFTWDFGDGIVREVTYTPEQLQFPKAVRKYYSVEATVERVFDGKWNLRGSYVWSHNFGNTEGLVLSDNGQTDAGITQQFDTPDLVRNTYGDLPNDRRHVFKAFGSYSITRNLLLGANLALASGKPINKIGYPGTDSIADFYGAGYLLVPRGSVGRTPWIFQGDLSLTWAPKIEKLKKLSPTIRLAIFNVLNRHGVTAVNELATTDEGTDTSDYLTATDFQRPRAYELSAGISF